MLILDKHHEVSTVTSVWPTVKVLKVNERSNLTQSRMAKYIVIIGLGHAWNVSAVTSSSEQLSGVQR